VQLGPKVRSGTRVGAPRAHTRLRLTGLTVPPPRMTSTLYRTSLHLSSSPKPQLHQSLARNIARLIPAPSSGFILPHPPQLSGVETNGSRGMTGWCGGRLTSGIGRWSPWVRDPAPRAPDCGGEMNAPSDAKPVAVRRGWPSRQSGARRGQVGRAKAKDAPNPGRSGEAQPLLLRTNRLRGRASPLPLSFARRASSETGPPDASTRPAFHANLR
jgi:hypothetical protein